jgi:hypothetical protein
MAEKTNKDIAANCIDGTSTLDIIDHIAAALDEAEARGAAHQKEATDSAYSERNKLVAYLARVFPSGLKRTEIDGWDPEWHGCVYVDTPEGQKVKKKINI